jgi:hypothetical protein
MRAIYLRALLAASLPAGLSAFPLWLPVLYDLMAFMKEWISPIRRMIARLRHM